jgi:hypothetical protein
MNHLTKSSLQISFLFIIIVIGIVSSALLYKSSTFAQRGVVLLLSFFAIFCTFVLLPSSLGLETSMYDTERVVVEAKNIEHVEWPAGGGRADGEKKDSPPNESAQDDAQQAGARAQEATPCDAGDGRAVLTPDGSHPKALDAATFMLERHIQLANRSNGAAYAAHVLGSRERQIQEFAATNRLRTGPYTMILQPGERI